MYIEMDEMKNEKYKPAAVQATFDAMPGSTQ